MSSSELPASFAPSAWARLFCAGVAIAGVSTTEDVTALVGLALLLMIILIGADRIGPAVTFLVKFWMPLALGLAAIWGLIVRGSPVLGYDAGRTAGIEYAALISLRVLCIALIFQCTFLTLSRLRLAQFLAQLSVRPSAIAVLISTINLTPDFRRRVEQVAAARCARGLMPNRSILTRARQLPWVLRTTFVSSIHTSLERADRWDYEQLPSRLTTLVTTLPGKGSTAVPSVLWCGVTVGWTLWAMGLVGT